MGSPSVEDSPSSCGGFHRTSFTKVLFTAPMVSCVILIANETNGDPERVRMEDCVLCRVVLPRNVLVLDENVTMGQTWRINKQKTKSVGGDTNALKPCKQRLTEIMPFPYGMAPTLVFIK